MFPALSAGDNTSHGVLCSENAGKWKGIFVDALRGVSILAMASFFFFVHLSYFYENFCAMCVKTASVGEHFSS